MMKDRDVIDSFVEHLRKHGHPDLEIDRRPDEENRDSPDIDAVAGPFVIEHTSIDSIHNQRRDSDWFMKAVGGLEQELPYKPPFRLNITLEYGAVTRGQDWKAIRQSLKNWIINDVPSLDDGLYVIDNICNVPFRLHVKKASSRPSGVIFARFEPNDNTLPDRIREQIKRKAEKLQKYYGHDQINVLLIESNDIALMDETTMMKSIQKACPTMLPTGVDQIWFADTSIPSDIEFMNFTLDIQQ